MKKIINKIKDLGAEIIAIVFLVVVSLILIVIIGAYARYWVYQNWEIGSQPFTTWVSEDESIEIKVKTYGDATGTIKLEDETIDFNAYFLGHIFSVVLYEGDKPDEIMIEEWWCSYKSKNKFVAKVSKSTTYFQEGQKIVFRKVEEDHNEN